MSGCCGRNAHDLGSLVITMEVTRKESKMSAGFDYPLPGLGSASCERIEYTEVSRDYPSGASYVGQVHGNKRAGNGVFTWPNGARYVGEFTDNVRNGRGL